MKGAIWRILRTVTKPAKLVHYKMKHMDGAEVRDGIITVLGFGGIVILLYQNAPYRNLGAFCAVCFMCFVVAGICATILSFLYPIAEKAVFYILTPFAWIFDYSDDRLNNAGRKSKTNDIRRNPKAKVGIKYFIEREKRLQINHAKLIE